MTPADEWDHLKILHKCAACNAVRYLMPPYEFYDSSHFTHPYPLTGNELTFTPMCHSNDWQRLTDSEAAIWRLGGWTCDHSNG